MTTDFLAFVSDPKTETVAEELIRTYWSSGVIIPGGAAAALNAVGSSKVEHPKFVIVDLSDSPNPQDNVLAVVEEFTESVVVFTGENNDVSLYRHVVKVGGADYLVHPFTAQDLFDSVMEAAAEKINTKGDDNDQANMIVVMGARGGVGASTFTINTGWILAEEHRRDVVLLDMDVHFGTLSIALDVEPSTGFRAALESPDRIDKTFLEGAMAKKTPRLSVMAAEEGLDSFISYNDEAIRLLIEKIRDNTDALIIDTPKSFITRFPFLIHDASKVVLLCELTVPSLRDSMNILAKIKEVDPAAEVLLIVNKERNKKTGQISIRDFEKELGKPVTAALPDMPEIACTALNNGKPMALVSDQAKVVQDLRTICKILDDQEVEEVKSSVLKKLLKPLGA